jgi:hypothetical protein
MEEKYKKLIGSINLIEPPKELRARIINRIDMEQKRLFRIKAWVFGSTSIASFSLSLWAVVYLIKSASASGFWQYFSLIFSENGSVLSYWRELSFSLAESLPITSFIMFFAAIGFFIWSFTNMLRKSNGKFIMSFS